MYIITYMKSQKKEAESYYIMINLINAVLICKRVYIFKMWTYIW